MSEQPSAIEIIKQQVTALADPSATFQQIEHGLGDLWTEAEQRGDTRAIEYLQLVWNNTQALAANNTAANNVAAAALQTAVEMAEQHAKLVTDLNERNEDNPLIAAIYEDAEERAYDLADSYYWEEWEGIHDDNPGHTAAQNGHLGDLPPEDIDDFMHVVYGDSDPLPEEMNQAVAEFIGLMIPAFRQYWTELRLKREADFQSRVAAIRQSQINVHEIELETEDGEDEDDDFADVS